MKDAPGGFWDKLSAGLGTKQQFSDAVNNLGTELRETAKGVPIAGGAVEQTPAMDQYEKDHPGRAMVAKGIGAAAATVPAIAAAPELFGAGAGQTLASRAGFSALTNGTIAGADKTARGGNADDVKHSALVAALIGGGVPVAGSAISAVAPYAKAAVRNMTSADTMHVPGGWIPESALAYYSGGLSEIPLSIYRLGKGVINTGKEIASGSPKLDADLAKAAADPSQAALMKSAMLRNALAQVLSGNHQQ